MQKKKQEKMEEYDRYIAEAKALAFGQGSSVPRPPSSPPPGGCYTSVGKRKIGDGRGPAIKGGMIQAMPRKGKGNASAEEIKKSEPSKKSLPPSSKAGPSRIYIPRASGKADAPWRRRQNASQVLFV